jgi:hypothetical protein
MATAHTTHFLHCAWSTCATTGQFACEPTHRFLQLQNKILLLPPSLLVLDLDLLLSPQEALQPVNILLQGRTGTNKSVVDCPDGPDVVTDSWVG